MYFAVDRGAPATCACFIVGKRVPYLANSSTMQFPGMSLCPGTQTTAVLSLIESFFLHFMATFDVVPLHWKDVMAAWCLSWILAATRRLYDCAELRLENAAVIWQSHAHVWWVHEGWDFAIHFSIELRAISEGETNGSRILRIGLTWLVLPSFGMKITLVLVSSWRLYPSHKQALWILYKNGVGIFSALCSSAEKLFI